MKKTVVLHVVSGLCTGGGIETFVRNLVENNVRDDIEYRFLVTETAVGDIEKDFVKRGIKVFHLEDDGSLRARISAKKDFFARHKGEFDVIHIHTIFTTAFFMGDLAKKYGAKKVILHSHLAANQYGWKTKLKNDLCRPFAARVSDVKLACSKDSGEFLFGKKAWDKEGIVLKNGIDLKRFAYSEEKGRTVRLSLGVKDGETLIGHVGRLNEAKNQTFLLDVFSEYKKQNGNAKLIMLGGGAAEEALRNKVKDLRLEESVIFVGVVNNVQDYYSAFDAFVFPSLYEGLPIALTEAQANGLYCLVSDRFCLDGLDEKLLKVLPLTDKSAWVKSIDGVVGQNADRAAVVPSIPDFDVKKTCERLAKIYLGDGYK